MTDKTFKKETFHCECMTSSHHFHVIHDLVENEIVVEIKLNHYLPWWKRILVAVQYVLGLDISKSEYDDVILSHPDRAKLAKMLVAPVTPKKEPKNVRSRKQPASANRNTKPAE